MTLRCAPDSWVLRVTRAVNVWRTRAQRPAVFLLYPSQNPPYRLRACRPLSYRVGCHGWRHVIQSTKTPRGRQRCLLRASQRSQRPGLHTSALCASASASRWSALSQQMSRLRTTLDSVSKAVSGTHADLLAKIARLKPNAAAQAGKEVESSSEVTPAQEESTAAPEPTPAPPNLTPVSAATATAATTPLSTAPEATSTPTPVVSTPTPTPVVSTPTPTPVVSTPTPTPVVSTPTPTPVVSTPTPTPVVSTPTTTTTPSVAQTNVTTQVPGVREKRVRRVATTAKTAGASKVDRAKPPPVEVVSKSSSSVPSASSTPPLFHPSGSLSVNLDETYSYLAHHVNAYFSSGTKTAAEKTEDDKRSGAVDPPHPSSDLVPTSESAAAPAAPTPRKGLGLGHYLASSAPTVQAFVGNYIAPLVPKFRAEPKSVAVVLEESPSAEGPSKPPEVTTVTKEQKADEEKARRLLLQREKIIARVSVDNRTRALVQALHRASEVRVYINRVEDLSYHLMEFPETRGTAIKEQLIPCLLRLRQASDPALQAAVRQALALVGYHNPVRGRGIRLLAIDGGGTRGLVALQTLHKLEALTGRPVYQLFDYICGVSTGAILGFMLGVCQIPLAECDDLYRKLGSDVFKQNVIVGTMKMGWNHAFYDSEPWETILKEKIGSDLMVETARNPECPKVAAVSTIVNRGTPLKAYVFRNYELQPGVRSHYLGGSQHQLWQALRASSAAPGYFQEFPLGQDLHQDGGLLVNNPTAVAIHECQCLWPRVPLECVLSLGTGRYVTPGNHSATYTSLKTKITNVISSATDTEEVHTMLDALLPPHTYFRFNPYMAEEIALDESRAEKLALLQAEGRNYLERNEDKLRRAAAILVREKGATQRLAEWAKLRADMYDRSPRSAASKL